MKTSQKENPSLDQLVDWSERLKDKISTSPHLAVAGVMEIKQDQLTATVVYPHETSLDEQLTNLQVYCQQHQVLALVFGRKIDNKWQFWRKIQNQDLIPFD